MAFDLKSVLGRNKEKEPYFKNRELVRRLGADSMVLLKNDGVLPISVGKIALFGAGAIDTIFSGTISNYVGGIEKVNVYDGLSQGGFTFSTTVWLEKMRKATIKAAKEEVGGNPIIKKEAGEIKHPEEVPISDADLAESVVGTDTCVYVLRRVTTINRDREYVPGDFLLSDVEQENIKKIASSFKKVIVVLNSGTIELGAVARAKSVRGILLMGVPGMEAGNSLFDILTGAVNPSGKLTDTWAKKYKDYPACFSFSKKNRGSVDVNYKEGIYVGYRYFDSFEVAPLFPFGYGLSYTKFNMKVTYLEANWFYVGLRVKVTNIGNRPGRDVVQVYFSGPVTKLDKPYQELLAFEKTKLIMPGESEDVYVKIPTTHLASFSEKKSAWIMEHGDYILRVGDSSKDTIIGGKIVLNKQVVIKNVANVIEPKVELDFIEPTPRLKENTGYVLTASLDSENYRAHNRAVKKIDTITTYVQEGSNYKSYVNANKFDIPFRCKEKIEYVKPISSHHFIDVVAGRVSMEDFVASLSPEVLARLCAGSYDESKKETENRLPFKIKQRRDLKVAGKTTDQFTTTYGIPGLFIADGPSGLHIPSIKATNYPSPLSMAQTWDKEAMEEMGDAYGEEMDYFGVDLCLAPALNIHRDPMGGRAHEYYSEDPVVSGLMAASFTKGVQSHKGRGVVLKHFAVYNQESNRRVVNCNISRRALREVYLRGFGMCIKASHPKGIMNSHNKINGLYASATRTLNMDILRAEWGFDGFVMSEWGTESEKAYDLHGGCDMIMPGFEPDKILQAMMPVKPEFMPDGYVDVHVRAPYYDKPMIVYDSWGSFLPDKNGPHEVSTIVESGVTLNPEISRLEEAGICKVENHIDGTKTVTYKGTDRGPFLALGDLQLCAMHILNVIKDSGAMAEISEQIARK